MSTVCNNVIGWKQPENRIGIVTKQKKRCQADGGRRVASHGLGDDLLRGKLWQLTKDSGAQVVIGDDPETARSGQGHEARDRLLDHGLVTIEGEQLLGAALAAQRPEARATSAGQNDGIEVRVRSHGRSKPNICAVRGERLDHSGTSATGDTAVHRGGLVVFTAV